MTNDEVIAELSKLKNFLAARKHQTPEQERIAVRTHFALDCALTSLKAIPDASDDINMKYRRELWLNHGHDGSALYGDDGEMQCHVCVPWDYRRAPLADVEKAAHEARLLRVSKALEAQAIAQTQEKG